VIAPRARHQRDRQRKSGEVADVLLDRFLDLLRFPFDPHAEHHFRRHGEQEQAAGDPKRRQRDAELAQEPVAE